MKKSNVIILVIIVIFAMLADNIMPQHPHICVDSTHTECDGECSCDAMECPKN